MELTSGIRKKFKKSFLLDEDSLRRIYALLEKAAKELPEQPPVVFYVEREDDRYYETKDINDVLSDPNIYGKKIITATVGLRKDKPNQLQSSSSSDWIVRVIFEISGDDFPIIEKDNVIIHIASDNKNWALLLSDELEPQVQRVFKAKYTPRWMLWLFVIPFIFLGLKISKLVFQPSSSFNEFLFPKDTSPLLTAVVVIFLVGFIFFMFPMLSQISAAPKWFIRAFGPESAFLWGEEAQSYNDREKTRQNLLWGVVVAFLISLVASILFGIMTN